jgi:hypothetical protein
MIWRRRRSVVSPRQQIWFGLEVVFATLGFIILCAFLLFVPPMSDWFGGEGVSPWLFDELNRFIFAKWPMVCVALVVLFVIGVVMAHRLSGPMLGLRKVISAWLNGDRKARVYFRKYDYLLPLKGPINLFLDRQEEILNRAQGLAEGVRTGLPADELKQKAEDLLTAMKPPEGTG